MIIYSRPKKAKSSKYGARKVMVDGLEFDSQREANRWRELKLYEMAGAVSELQRQVKYTLIPAQYIDGKCAERACDYIADFVYRDKDGELVVEDSKGMRTREYIIKRKLMLKLYGIRIKET